MESAPVTTPSASGPRRHLVRGVALALLVAATSLAMAWPLPARAAAESAVVGSEVAQLDARVSALERQAVAWSDRGEFAVLLFLFGAFCALWAQNTGRNPWIWFFLGAALNGATVLYLLWNNAQDQGARRRR